MKCLVVSVVFIFWSFSLKAQLFQEDYKIRHDSTFEEGSLYLALPGSVWFYNNEYFNPFYEGYTLMGGNFQPQFIYQSNPKLKISAGADLLKYYGNNINTRVRPLFSIEYKPSEHFKFLMGSFNGGENHRMNDVLFSFEKHLVNLNVNGILIDFRNNHIFSETWLSWEQFIVPGDSLQEMFTAGSSDHITVFDNSSINLTVPLELLAHHRGGQINVTDKHIETLINLSEGLRLTKNFGGSDKVFAELDVFHSLGDFVPSPGIAISAKTGVQYKTFEFNAEYFRGDDFLNFAGNPLYLPWKLSADETYYEIGGMQEMVNFKAGYRKKIGSDSFLFLRFEGYYLMEAESFDYSYSLHLQVNDLIKIRSKKTSFND